MSLRQSGGYKALLVLASVACVGGAGFLAYKTFFEKGGSVAGLQAAEQAYKKGVDTLANNPQEAKVKFDEAALTVENSLKKLEQDRQGMKTEEADKVEGMLQWLKARAIRDKAYAQGKIDGAELGETADSTTGEKFRNYLNVTDEKAKNEAIVALRVASEKVTDNPELIKDALRVELSHATINWQFAEPACKNAIKLNPKDARAHFFLAKFYFEQPESASGVWAAKAYDVRDGGRIEADAKPHLKEARANNAPMWRVNHLEAEIAAWELFEAKRGKSKPAIEKKTQDMEALLFSENGMLAKAKKGVGFKPISTVDARGIFGVHGIAMKYATELDGEAADKTGRVGRVSDALNGACAELAKAEFGDMYLEEAGEVIAVLLNDAQPFVATTTPDAWKKMKDDATAFLTKYPKAKERPRTTWLLASIMLRDAQLNRANAPKLNAEAITTLEAGLEGATKAGASAELLAEYHAALAEVKLLSNRPLPEAEAHIRELRKIDSFLSRAKTNFLDGVVAQRFGKLDKARTLLTAVTTDKDAKNTSLGFQAITRLAPIALATDDPDAAAGYYGQIADALKQPKALTPSEREWADMAAGSVDEAVALQVVSMTRAGLKRIRQDLKNQPAGTPAPRGLIDQVLDPAERLAATLKKLTATDRTARLALAEFRAVTGDTGTADKMLTALTTDYPDSVDLLRLQVARTLIPAKGQKEADADAKKKAEGLIQAFTAANPGSQTGKLFWAQWLMANKRSKEAVDYLRDPKNFTNPDVVKRVLATALAQSGEREEARKLLGVDPLDPAADILLMEAAIAKLTAEEKKEILSRYEQSGMTRLFEASRKMADGKFEEAATDFNASVEYAALRKAAVSLLQRSLIGFAGQDPKKAAERIAEYIGEKPDLAELYMPAALAALYLDEVGEPTDAWGTKRTMYAAVNKWEQLTLKNQPVPTATVGLTKTQFHMFAGNPLLARQEAIRVNGQFPNHLPTLLFLAEQYIVGQDHNLDQAKLYLQRAQDESKADDPTPELLYGAWLEAKKDLDGAAKHYESLTTRYAAINAPYARRVLVAQAQQKTGEAVLWANKWLEKFPNDPAAALQLVQVLAVSGEAADAVTKADEFVTKQVEASDAQLKALKPEPKPEDMAKLLMIARAQAQLQTASVFFQARVFPEAKKRVEVVLKEIPDSPAALLMAGDIAVMEKDWKRAEEVYRARLKAEKRDFVAANNLAWLLVAQKDDPKEAYQLVSDIRQGIGGKPLPPQRLPPDFLDTIGLVYVKLNDRDKFAEMQKLFDEAVKRYPTDPRMHLFLGQAHAGRGDDPKAQASLKAAVRLAEDATNKFLRDDQKVETKKKAEEALAKIAKK